MTREDIFNREVADIIRRLPSWQICTIVQKYMEEQSQESHYEALQQLGASIGIEFHVIEILSSKTGKVKAWWPAIKYNEGNILNGRSYTEKFMNAPFNKPLRCYGYLARQYIYKLNDATNFRKGAVINHVNNVT